MDPQLNDNQRRSQRIETHELVSVTPAGPNFPEGSFVVELLDSSERGVGFVSREAMTHGQHLVIRAVAGKGAGSLYRVACCRKLPAKTYKIGAEFLYVLSESADMTDPATIQRISEAIVS
jgi:hypothetical protein